MCEYLGNVVDIREQYPVHPITETLALAHELGIVHPEFGGHARSVTTDALLTIDDGNTRWQLARSLKYAADLTDARTRENLELERQAWRARGIGWELLTEHELPEVLGQNLRWLRTWDKGGRGEVPSVDIQRYFLVALADQSFSQSLGFVITRVAERLRISRLLAIHVFRFLAWHRQIEVDLYAPLHLTKPHAALASNFRRATS
ncbi:TnsA endonuclease N-terminal domain-containing protein [Pandoraea sp. NPDC090278]|uniref:TnsA endonuclease N-terminal domain-containing protein n=1 Tax=Pandoraea sp. NPDC090278 TaxID=3364391 RepID=UPI00383B89A6